MRNKKLFLCLNFLIVFLVSACGGGGNGSDTDDKQQTVTYEQSEKTIQDAAQVLSAALALGDFDAAYDQLATHLQQQEYIESVSVFKNDDEPKVIAKLKNGALLTFPLIEIPDPPLNYHPKSRLLQKQQLNNNIQARSNFDLPATKKALFLELQGLPTNASELADLAEDRGYDVSRNQHAGVEFFKTVGAYSLLHINTHGDHIKWGGKEYTTIGTDDKRNTDQDLAYEINGDFADIRVVLGRGVYVIGDEDPWVSEDTYYFVTDQFFDKYVSAFPNYSIAYMDACFSAYRPLIDPKPELPPLAKVLLENKNIGAYLGWTKSVANKAAIRASDYLYSRMLFSNEHFEPVYPPLLPWGLTDSFDGLASVGYNRDTFSSRRKWKQAELVFMPKNFGSFDQYDVRLLPTVSGLNVSVDIVDQSSVLNILGDFGADTGQVWNCDEPSSSEVSSCDQLNVDSWDEFEIVADITSCTDCSGYIMVTVDDHDSNAHPLSLWKSELTVSGTGGIIGPDINGTVKFSASAEIVDERTNPENEPEIQFATEVAEFALSSKFEYQFSGNFEDSIYFYDYPANMNKGSIDVSAGEKSAFAGAIVLNPGESLATFSGTAAVEGVVEKTSKTAPFTKTTESVTVVVPFYFEASMNQYGVIQEGNVSLGTISIEWPTINPQNAPDENTPR